MSIVMDLIPITFFIGLSAFVVCGASLFLLPPYAHRFNLVDAPDQNKKQHEGEIPLIGGICLYIAVSLSLLISNPGGLFHFHFYISILCLTGIIDDAKGLSVKARILIQLAVALLVCLLDDHLITYIGDIIGIGDIGTRIFAIPITMLAIVTAINAFNMIDGIDGLATSIALVCFIFLGIIFWEREMWPAFHICVAFVAGLVPFLISNLGLSPYRKKVFLGDAGSMVIGFVIVWLLIEGSQPIDRANPMSRAFSPVTALWFVGVPLFDLISVSLRRMIRGHSPLSGDRDHIHHILMDNGLGSRQSLIFCSGLQLLLAVIGAGFNYINQEVLSFVAVFVAFAIFHMSCSNYSNSSNFQISFSSKS